MIAIFPGRFQPPHLGHVLTLMRIYPLYDKIIVAIIPTYTYEGRKRQVVEPREVKRTLEAVFEHLPKIQVTMGGKEFLNRTSFDDLPRFDVVVTGNLATIHQMEKLGVKNRYAPRSKIGKLDISGTMLRELHESVEVK